MKIEPPNSKAQPLLRVIVGAVRRGRIEEGRPETFLAYSDALKLLGVSKIYRAGKQLQRKGLNDLNDWTRTYDIPKIAALIVNKSTHRPSEMFWKSHDIDPKSAEAEDWWMEQANQSIYFDWKPFLLPITRYRREAGVDFSYTVGEDTSEELLEHSELIVNEPPTEYIDLGRSKVTEILHWMASGKTERDILREHQDLSREDIRASLAYAASQLSQISPEARRLSHPTFVEKWGGKFELPKPDSTDPRLTHILEKYEGLRG